MDEQLRDLLRSSLRKVIGSGVELRRSLDGLGWSEVVTDDAEGATTLLFTEHGRALACSRALEEVVLAALGPRDVTDVRSAVVVPMPPAPDWRVDPARPAAGLVLAPLRDVDELVWPVWSGSAETVVRLAPCDVRVEAMDLMDGTLGWHRVTPLVEFHTGEPATTSAAVAAARRALSAEIIGASAAALDLACEHTSVRRQFGRELATFQAVRHRLADAHVAITSASGALSVAWANTSSPDGGQWAAAVAKFEAGRAQATVATHVLQVFGATGLTREHPLHRFVTRAATLDVLFGSHRQIEADIGARLMAGATLEPVAELV